MASLAQQSPPSRTLPIWVRQRTSLHRTLMLRSTEAATGSAGAWSTGSDPKDKTLHEEASRILYFCIGLIGIRSARRMSRRDRHLAHHALHAHRSLFLRHCPVRCR